MPPARVEPDFLAGAGEMRARIREFDWSRTPLGPIEQWPQSLRTTVSLCLASNFPINIIWGPEHTQIYNDGYREVCGEVHPRALGENYAVTWASAWPAIGESFGRALGGETMYLVDQRMFLKRLNGELEETFFTFSHSPILDESGGVGGLFHPVTETTPRMLAGRRTRSLRDLSSGLSAALDEAEVARLASEILSRFQFDLPFFLFYALDPAANQYRLRGRGGIMEGSTAAPESVAFGANGPWPFAEALGALHAVEADAAFARNDSRGPYEEAPRRAFILPIIVPGAERPPAIVVLGASPRLRMTDDYRIFFDLLGLTISNAMATVRALEDERRRVEALAEIDRAKTIFFSNVSHEFRTPLTLMLGPLENVLAKTGVTSPEDRAQLETVHRNSLRLLKLVNSLLDFSRIEAGRIEAAYEPTNLSTFTAELAGVFRSAMEKAGLRLVVDTPELSGPVYVDREMWEKIVLNLLSNAFKFTFEGEVRVSLSSRESGVELIIADTGVGIPQEELPRIFDRFHRVHGTQGRSFEGSGIGLALVKELVALHGGSVRAESEPDRGSRFIVTIPFGKEHLPAERIGAHRSQQSTAARTEVFADEAAGMLMDAHPANDPDAGGTAYHPEQTRDPAAAAGLRPLIVVADDNADMRDYVTRLLKDAYDVIAVMDGAAALEAIFDAKPDLVLSDIMMPNLDGFGLLRALRADPRSREIPVIFLSARAGEEARIEGLETGADDYLIKPFSARELLARVEATLKLQRVRNESNRALRESEHRYRTLFNSMDEGCCTIELIYDPAGECTDFRYLDVNPAFEKQSGLANVKGRRIREVLPDIEQHWIDVYSRVALTGEPARLENKVEALGKWIDIHAFRVDHPESRRVAVVFNDITERRQREEDLRQTNEDLEHFAYSASHDLQEPIRTVGLYSRLLAAKLGEEMGEESLQILEHLRGGVESMNRLLRDLLTYTRMVTLAASVELSDGNDALQKASGNLEGAIQASRAQVIAEALPLVKVHPIHLEQLLQNIIGNAVKYLSKDRLPVVRIAAERENTMWRFSVSDNGIGIAREYREQIFEPFQRLHSRVEYAGSGLGLSICRRIVERYRGRIWVESTPGEGSTFFFTLPA